MKVAVIVSDACHMVNVGGELDRFVRTFDVPDDMAAFIENYKDGTYTTISIAIVNEPPTDKG